MDTKLTRPNAINACIAAGINHKTDLVSIPDLQTNDFVLTLVSWRSWISLEKKHDVWVWSDGTNATWQHWIPPNPTGDGKYAEIVKDAWAGVPGQWNDLASSHLRGFVCQYDFAGLLEKYSRFTSNFKASQKYQILTGYNTKPNFFGSNKNLKGICVVAYHFPICQ